MLAGINLVNDDEAKQQAAFAKWRLSQGFDIRTDRERDLHEYVNGLISEIADLKADLYRK